METAYNMTKKFNKSSNYILVTGGAGFIGSNLVERLLRENQAVICLDNFNDYYNPCIKENNIANCLDNSNFALIKGDIRDVSLLEKIFREFNIDRIVHLAARAGVRASLQQPMLYEDVNVKGTLNILEMAKKHSIQSFIFGSSSSVYGATSKVPFKEDDPADRPISPYAATKRAGELLCYNYHHLYNIPVTCLRFFTVYGPRQRLDMAIHKFVKLIDEGKKITLFGDGTSKRDYTYVSDAIDGIISAINFPFDFEIFNLGGSTLTELRQLVAFIEDAFDKKTEIKTLHKEDLRNYKVSTDKAKKELDFVPKFSPRDSVRKILNNLLNKDGSYFIEEPSGELCPIADCRYLNLETFKKIF